MSDPDAKPASVESLVLDILRAIRADVSTIKADLRDVKMRLSSIEQHMVGQQMGAIILGRRQESRHSSRSDEIDVRIERLEKRLELNG